MTLIEQKSKVFLFIAGHNLVSSDVDQVGTVEDLQAGVCVCVCDRDNPLGNFVSLFLSNRTSSSVFLCFSSERVSQASGSTYRVSVVVVHREAEA